MQVRKATSADVPKILGLLQLKADFDRGMRGFEGEISATQSKLQITLFGALPLAHVLLAEETDKIYGFAFYHYRFSSFSAQPSVWLDDLLVVADARSKGTGALLMDRLQREAKKINATHIGWTASPLNKKAQKFYQRIGAAIERFEGDRPFYRWEVAL